LVKNWDASVKKNYPNWQTVFQKLSDNVLKIEFPNSVSALVEELQETDLVEKLSIDSLED